MKTHRFMLRWACAGACAFGLAAASVAAPVVKTGLSLDGSLGDAAIATTPAGAYAAWEALVAAGSIRSEGFERSGVGAELTGETFQDNLPRLEFRPAVGDDPTFATMLPSAPLIPGDGLDPPTPNPGIVIESATAISGRFNTTPGVNLGHWWESTGDFTIAFDDPVSAFGLFITDSADFAGSLRILLDGVELDPLLVANEGNPTGDGSLLFFGFADSQKVYREITFDITQTTATLDDYDVFGFDDLVIGAALDDGNGGGTAPEPGSLALVGASLFGLALARRRRRT